MKDPGNPDRSKGIHAGFFIGNQKKIITSGRYYDDRTGPGNWHSCNVSFTYDGSPKIVTATTNPAGLAVLVTCDRSPTAPTNAGFYYVKAHVRDPNDAGSADRYYSNRRGNGGSSSGPGPFGLLITLAGVGALAWRQRKQRVLCKMFMKEARQCKWIIC